MGDQTKSPLEIMLDEARKLELEALERKQRESGLADLNPFDLLTGGEQPKPKRRRADFHNLRLVKGGKWKST